MRPTTRPPAQSAAALLALHDAGAFTELRVRLEPLWAAHHAGLARQWGRQWYWSPETEPVSTNLCVHSSALVGRLARALGLSGLVAVNGTVTPTTPRRPTAPAFPWTHYWCTVDGLAVDLTADQFGGPPVLVGPLTGGHPWGVVAASETVPIASLGKGRTVACWHSHPSIADWTVEARQQLLALGHIAPPAVPRAGSPPATPHPSLAACARP